MVASHKQITCKSRTKLWNVVYQLCRRVLGLFEVTLTLLVLTFPNFLTTIQTRAHKLLHNITSLDALVDMEKAMKRDKIEVNDRQVKWVVCVCVYMSVACMCICVSVCGVHACVSVCLCVLIDTGVLCAHSIWLHLYCMWEIFGGENFGKFGEFAKFSSLI